MSINNNVISPERIEAIYTELERMHIHLEPEPLRFGPEDLQNKTAHAQNMLSRVEQITTAILHEFHVTQRKHLSHSKRLDIKTKDLIANNEEVAKGSSIKDRMSRAHTYLIEDIREVDDLEIAIRDYELVLEVLKAKRSELKNLQQRIKDQFRMVQEEISLGGNWGRPRTPYKAISPGQGRATFEDSEDIDRLLHGVDSVLNEVEVDDYDEEDEEDEEVIISSPEELKISALKDASEIDLPFGDTGLDSETQIEDIFSSLEVSDPDIKDISMINSEIDLDDLLSEI